MKRFAFIFACVLMAFSASAQTDTMRAEIDSTQVEALRIIRDNTLFIQSTKAIQQGKAIYSPIGLYSTVQPDTMSVLTIEQVKACIGFPKDSPIYTSLVGIIDCHYKMALQSGMTEPQAATVALNKFGEFMLTLGK